MYAREMNVDQLLDMLFAEKQSGMKITLSPKTKMTSVGLSGDGDSWANHDDSNDKIL